MGTAVTTQPDPNTPEGRKALRAASPSGQIPPAIQVMLDERKMKLGIAGQIATQSWGANLADIDRRAIAAYLVDNKLDVSEIDMLGGRIYRNANLYLRRLSEMTEEGLVEYAKPDLIHHDARLDELAKDEDAETAAAARRERTRRMQERIANGVPENADAACIFRVKLRNVDEEWTAAKWHVPGRKKKTRNGDVNFDPVGDEYPVETVITRATRRCMRFVASKMPQLQWREQELDDRAAEVGVAIRDARIRMIEAEERDRQAGVPQPVLSAGYDDAPRAALPAGQPVQVVEAPPSDRRAQTLAVAQANADLPDPYDADDAPEDVGHGD